MDLDDVDLEPLDFNILFQQQKTTHNDNYKQLMRINRDQNQTYQSSVVCKSADAAVKHVLPRPVAKTVSALARLSHSSLSLVDKFCWVWFKSVVGGTSLAFDTLIFLLYVLDRISNNTLGTFNPFSYGGGGGSEAQQSLVQMLSGASQWTKLMVLSCIQWWYYFTFNSIRAADDILLLLNSVFGHTDTSRALSSFLALVDHELRFPTNVKQLVDQSPADSNALMSSALTLNTLRNRIHNPSQFKAEGYTMLSVGIVKSLRSFLKYCQWQKQRSRQLYLGSDPEVVFRVVLNDEASSKAYTSKATDGEQIDILLHGVQDYLKSGDDDDDDNDQDTDEDNTAGDKESTQVYEDDDVEQPDIAQKNQKHHSFNSGGLNDEFLSARKYQTLPARNRLSALEILNGNSDDKNTYEIHWDQRSAHSMASSYATLPSKIISQHGSRRSPVERYSMPVTNVDFGISESESDLLIPQILDGGLNEKGFFVADEEDEESVLANDDGRQSRFEPYHESAEELLENLTHFSKYATAAYGRRFMKLMGIADYPSASTYSNSDTESMIASSLSSTATAALVGNPIVDSDGRTHHSKDVIFAWHCGLELEEIVSSSFYLNSSTMGKKFEFYDDLLQNEIAGGVKDENVDFSAQAESQFIQPVMKNLPEYFISYNHGAQAIVVTIRGTLTLNDLLTNLGCEYQRVRVGYDTEGFVHGGMWRRAKSLADQSGKMHKVVKRALEQHPEYGVILVGHSLGAGVACMVGLIWSNLSGGNDGGFNHNGGQSHFETSIDSGLPPGRRLHVYAYGPPCTMSLELSQVVKGLVTSVIHGDDFTSSLCLGSILDIRDLVVSHSVLEEDASFTPTHHESYQQDQYSQDSTLVYDEAATPTQSRPFSSSVAHNDNEHPSTSPLTVSFLQNAYNKLRSQLPFASTQESSSGVNDTQSNDNQVDQRSSDIFEMISSRLHYLKLYPAGDVYKLWSEKIEQASVSTKPDADPLINTSTKFVPSSTFNTSPAPSGDRMKVNLVKINDIESMFSQVKFTDSMMLDHSPGRYESLLQALSQTVLQ
ncbi:hypothetical protein MP228_012303 [Amoeboaphelidium protococcarum]|nr:hypothetical protein MP228_012303 [Amoeboaphelidium protococcarum]